MRVIDLIEELNSLTDEQKQLPIFMKLWFKRTKRINWDVSWNKGDIELFIHTDKITLESKAEQ